MMMPQEVKFIWKTKQLKREQFLILLKLLRSLHSRVSSGVKLHLKRTLSPDLERIQITIEFSLKMMNQIGNQWCGGITRLVISNVRTAMMNSTAQLKITKWLILSSLWPSLEFNHKMPLNNAHTSMTSTSLTTSKDFWDWWDFFPSLLLHSIREL
jgi:hypothetical protein